MKNQLMALSEILDAPDCDLCGEDFTVITYEGVGLCGDCAGNDLRPSLQSKLGYIPCARVLQLADCRVVCLEPYGVEHDHQS